MTSSRVSASLALGALVGCGALAAQERAVVIEAARIVVAPRTVLEGDVARIALRAGEVVAVGAEIPRELLESARRVRFDGATILPGFVLAHDYLDLADDLAERVTAFTPELEAADAFDPWDERLASLARDGITTVGLAPSSINTVGGVGAVVQWRGQGGEILAPKTYMKFALVPESLDQDRAPTSRMGAADLIRSRFESLQRALAPNDLPHRALNEVLTGARPAAFHARAYPEILEALDLSEGFGLQPLVLGAGDAGDCIERLRAVGASVVLSPLEFTSERDMLELPAKLEASGIEFSFSATSGDALRLSAALAVRHGLSRDAAVAALTRTAAKQLQIADRVGSLRSAHRADFTVWSGDPIDLTSTLREVWIAGQRVPSRTEVAEGPSK